MSLSRLHALSRLGLLGWIVILGACESATEPSRVVPINVFATGGAPIAEFRFEQRGDAVSLSIHSITTQTVTFTYTVSFALNLATWSSQGSVTGLNAGGSVDKGRIATNQARIDLGQIAVVLTSLTYN